MDRKQRELGRGRVVELRRLPLGRRPGDRDVSEVIARTRERQHVGRVVFPGVGAVQALKLTVARQPHRHGHRPGRKPRRHLRHGGRTRQHVPDEGDRDRDAHRLDDLGLK